jgi:nucleotide-binding universal stress UspA family protein
MQRDTMDRANQSTRFRIVVGVGRDATSEHAVRDALALATRGDDGEVHAVMALSKAFGEKLDGLRERMREEEDWLVEYVRWVADRTALRPTRLDLVFHLRIGDAAETLTQVAFDVGATLIVVGDTRRSHVAHALRSGVADRLLADGRYPVLVARPIDTHDLTLSARPEPPRPGEHLQSTREEVLESSDRVDYSSRSNHVSGLF